MTGQNEILDLCHRLREKFPKAASKPPVKGSAAKKSAPVVAAADAVNPTDGALSGDEAEGEDEDESVEENESEAATDGDEAEDGNGSVMQGLHVLPLYSSLPAREQAKVRSCQYHRQSLSRFLSFFLFFFPS